MFTLALILTQLAVAGPPFHALDVDGDGRVLWRELAAGDGVFVLDGSGVKRVGSAPRGAHREGADHHLVVDSEGRVLVGGAVWDWDGERLTAADVAAPPATGAAFDGHPDGTRVTGGTTVRRVGPDGAVTTYDLDAGCTLLGLAIAPDHEVVASCGPRSGIEGHLWRIPAEGEPRRVSLPPEGSALFGLAVDEKGTLWAWPNSEGCLYRRPKASDEDSAGGWQAVAGSCREERAALAASESREAG